MTKISHPLDTGWYNIRALEPTKYFSSVKSWRGTRIFDIQGTTFWKSILGPDFWSYLSHAASNICEYSDLEHPSPSHRCNCPGECPTLVVATTTSTWSRNQQDGGPGGFKKHQHHHSHHHLHVYGGVGGGGGPLRNDILKLLKLIFEVWIMINDDW